MSSTREEISRNAKVHLLRGQQPEPVTPCLLASELLQERQHDHHLPFLNNLGVDDPIKADRRNPETAAARLDALIVRPLHARNFVTNSGSVSIDEEFLDFVSAILKTFCYLLVCLLAARPG